MSDWDSVKKAADADRQWREEWQQASANWHKAAEAALIERVDRFASDLSGKLHVSREWQPAPGDHPPMVVLIGVKPLREAGPDVVGLVRVGDEPYYTLEVDGESNWKTSYTLEALIDQLVLRASRLIDNPRAGTSPSIGPSYIQHRAAEIRSLERTEWWRAVYFNIGAVVGALAGLGTWISLGAAWGIWGALLGWIPALIVGLLAGVFWGVLLLGILLLVFVVWSG